MGYDFTARTRFDRVFTGLYIQLPATMLEDAAAVNAVYDSSDTLDADYGRLLSQCYGKCLASPMPASWNQIVAWLKQIDAVRLAA